MSARTVSLMLRRPTVAREACPKASLAHEHASCVKLVGMTPCIETARLTKPGHLRVSAISDAMRGDKTSASALKLRFPTPRWCVG